MAAYRYALSRSLPLLICLVSCAHNNAGAPAAPTDASSQSLLTFGQVFEKTRADFYQPVEGRTLILRAVAGLRKIGADNGAGGFAIRAQADRWRRAFRCRAVASACTGYCAPDRYRARKSVAKSAALCRKERETPRAANAQQRSLAGLSV